MNLKFWNKGGTGEPVEKVEKVKDTRPLGERIKSLIGFGDTGAIHSVQRTVQGFVPTSLPNSNEKCEICKKKTAVFGWFFRDRPKHYSCDSEKCLKASFEAAKNEPEVPVSV